MMRASMALGRMALMTASGISLAQAREMIGYDGPVAQDAKGEAGPEVLWAQARLVRFEERSRKRTRFRHHWWRRIATVQVAGFYLTYLLVHYSSVVDLFRGMNLRLPWLTKQLIESSYLPLPLLILMLLLALPGRRVAEDDLEDEARLCLRLNLDLLRGASQCSSPSRLTTGSVAQRLLHRIDGLWESRCLRRSVVEWAELAEWELDLGHERRQVRAAVVFLVMTSAGFLALGCALFMPFYCLMGCLC